MPDGSAYSTFRSPIAKEFKRAYPSQTEDQFVKFADALWYLSMAGVAARHGRASLETRSVFIERDSVTVELTAAFLWRYRRIDHYFLDPGVAEFCAGSVREVSKDFCKPIPECSCRPPKSYKCPWLALNRDTRDPCGGFAIHFPKSERDRSLIVIPQCGIVIDGGAALDGTILMGGFYGTTDGDNVTIMCSPHLMDGSTGSWTDRLVMGMSLYLDAFPDAVIPAADRGITKIKHIDGMKMAVTSNELVSDDARHCKSPHWRRGHFRVLTAERFTRKRGMTVYVRGAFVLGNALDVLDDAPASRDVGEP